MVVQDPYERKMVAVIRSRVQGGGEGLVARRHLTQGTVIGRGHPAIRIWTGGLGSQTCKGKGHLAVGSMGICYGQGPSSRKVRSHTVVRGRAIKLYG